jgi:hypothetical protein
MRDCGSEQLIKLIFKLYLLIANGFGQVLNHKERGLLALIVDRDPLELHYHKWSFSH